MTATQREDQRRYNQRYRQKHPYRLWTPAQKAAKARWAKGYSERHPYHLKSAAQKAADNALSAIWRKGPSPKAAIYRVRRSRRKYLSLKARRPEVILQRSLRRITKHKRELLELALFGLSRVFSKQETQTRNANET